MNTVVSSAVTNNLVGQKRPL
uniref:Uncharacterized protein n=1 Tax=Anguilla anguilla TaxID=7936 RepID=A0A0E9U4J8_ANGAN